MLSIDPGCHTINPLLHKPHTCTGLIKGITSPFALLPNSNIADIAETFLKINVSLDHSDVLPCYMTANCPIATLKWFTRAQLVSLWFTLVHFGWFKFIWTHLGSLGFTWVDLGLLWFDCAHLGSLGFTWVPLSSLWFTWVCLGLLWFPLVHLGSLGFTWFSWVYLGLLRFA